MSRLARRAFAIGSLVATVSSCVVDTTHEENADEHTNAVAEAVYFATSNPDTTYSAVGYLQNKNNGQTFCTGTLIAPNVVLTAAHCFAAYATGCAPLTGPIGQATVNSFVLSPGGTTSGAGTPIDIDDIKIAPSAYVFAANDCPTGSTANCSTVSGNTGIRRGSDLALLHLATPAPGNITPIPVLTSLADSYYANGAIIHAPLDPSSAFLNRASAPKPHVVGWGTPSCGGIVRRSGLAIFDTIGPAAGAWHKGCAEYQRCDGSTNPSLSCSYTSANGAVNTQSNQYQVDSIRINRDSSIPGAFDGAVPANGDSGGPLLLDGFGPLGNPITYAMGAFSAGYQTDPNGMGLCSNPPPNGPRMGEYSAAFTAETGTFIEKTLVYWQSAEYANRNLGWSPTWENRGGALSSGPSADSRSSNMMDSFVRGTDNKLWQYVWNGSAWFITGPISNDLLSSPPTSTASGSRVDVAARAANGSLLHWWFTGAWHVENLGGIILAGTAPSMATWGGDSIHIFLLGSDRALYYKHYEPSGWVGYEYLGAYMANMSSSPAVTAWAPGRLDVFAQRSDGLVVAIYKEQGQAPALGWQFGAFTQFPYSVYPSNGVAAASWAPGRIDIVARAGGNSGQIIQWSRTDQGWYNGPSNVIYGGGSTPALTSMRPGRLDLFSQNTGSSPPLLHAFFPNE
jgi:hypothetical protein